MVEERVWGSREKVRMGKEKESETKKGKDVISSVNSFLSIGQKHVVWL